MFLFGDAHKKLWAMTEDALKPLTPAEAFPNTQAKLQGFAAGAGTILFFEDTDIVKNLQDSFHYMRITFLFGLNKQLV